ncbi:MAG: flagellar biosynthetic protein FliO [Defluviitaleaceae bacterium]|nr:flagellar biosynthetic protein FliO [Defluviitaleaceae bacterium]
MENFIFLLSEGGFSFTADPLFSMLWQMIRFLGATALVAFLAYIATKKMVGARFSGQRSGNLSIVESVNVSGQAVVQLIKAGDKYIVIGVTKERITLLGEVDKEQISENVELQALDTPFGKVLSRFIKNAPESGGENDEHK